MTNTEALRVLVNCAMRTYDHSTTQEKIKLLRACSVVLPGAEGEHAGQSAFLLERLDVNQYKFRQLLQEAK